MAKQKISKILLVTLSNIGDVILTFPVLDYLKNGFPAAEITVISGPRPKDLFENNPVISEHIVYDKHAKFSGKLGLYLRLRKKRFDLVVDLRDSFFNVLLGRNKYVPLIPFWKGPAHMSKRHLYRALRMLRHPYKEALEKIPKKSLFISPADKDCVNGILKHLGIEDGSLLAVISAGARSHIKRWPEEYFSSLISELLKEHGCKIVLAGDKDEIGIMRRIIEGIGENVPVFDLSGKISITQFAFLLKKTAFFITNDSASLHLASYIDVPTVAIFGPTDETRYGPWGSVYEIAKKDVFCRPCSMAQCRFKTLECMRRVKVEDVLNAVKRLKEGLARGNKKIAADGAGKRTGMKMKRVLIVRTDRIGDVLLSTPVIKAVRDFYPHAYIAVMVSPYAKDIVNNNPYLDEVILYDKDRRHKGWFSSIGFSFFLRKRKFDTAIVLHPSNRAHITVFLAGIKRRVGYNRKLGMFLTDRLPHTKQSGKKHEVEYNLDFLRYLGVETSDKNLFMPIENESEKKVDALFIEEGIRPGDKLLAVHPGASCVSKRWPVERFAEAADILAKRFGFRVIVVAAEAEIEVARGVVRKMRTPAIDLSGRTSVSELASVLKRCALFISNDSGPVHIAAALGVPVISIFGRNQRGLSPLRWKPLGQRCLFLHEETGCGECLAHKCEKGFICLKAIEVEDVVLAARQIMDGK